MLLSALGICVGCSANDGIEVLTPQQFNDMVQSDSLATVLDVRRPEEYANGHLKNAILINWLDATAFDKGIEQLDKTRHYYIYCRSGRRCHTENEKPRLHRLRPQRRHPQLGERRYAGN